MEVNIVLVGLNGDGGYRYSLNAQKLEEFLRASFSTHRPSCQETGEPLDIEHRVVYNIFPVSTISTSLHEFILFLLFLLQDTILDICRIMLLRVLDCS